MPEEWHSTDAGLRLTNGCWLVWDLLHSCFLSPIFLGDDSPVATF